MSEAGGSISLDRRIVAFVTTDRDGTERVWHPDDVQVVYASPLVGTVAVAGPLAADAGMFDPDPCSACGDRFVEPGSVFCGDCGPTGRSGADG